MIAYLNSLPLLEPGTNVPRPSPGEVLSFFGVSPVNYSDSDLILNDLGRRSRNDLDLQYSHTFKNSISCLHLSTFRSQTAIVSEKSTVSYRKA